MRAATLAAVVALLSGLLLLLAARAGLGVIADFLSKPVLVGYMTGAALILMASQMDKFFGIRLKSTDFFPRLVELMAKVKDSHGLTLMLGLGCSGGIDFIAPVCAKNPRCTFCRLRGALVVTSVWFQLDGKGVSVVGSFPRGLPGFAFPTVTWLEVQSLLTAAIGITLLTYTEGVLLARAFAAKNGYEVSANQELVALGMADLAAGLFSGLCHYWQPGPNYCQRRDRWQVPAYQYCCRLNIGPLSHFS